MLSFGPCYNRSRSPHNWEAFAGPLRFADNVGISSRELAAETEPNSISALGAQLLRPAMSYLFVLAALFAHLSISVTQLTVCNESCQQSERTALLAISSSLSSSHWANSSGWTSSGALSTNHCSWHGVVCCSADGIAAVPLANARALLVSCAEANSVAALYLADNLLQGTISDDAAVWEALPGLTYLQLTGAHPDFHTGVLSF